MTTGYCGDCGADERGAPYTGEHAEERLNLDHDYRPGYTVEDDETRRAYLRTPRGWDAAMSAMFGRWAREEAAESGLPVDPMGRSGLHGRDGWCGETRQHVHGLSEGIIEYTDGRDAAGEEIE